MDSIAMELRLPRKISARAQRLEKGLAGAEIVHEEGVAVIGWENPACPQGSEAWLVFPEAYIQIASWRTQGPSPHQVEHLFPLGPGLVGYVFSGCGSLFLENIHSWP